MKVNFFLPGIGFKIIGGNKVVYQYANYLSRNGFDVCIYYDAVEGKNKRGLPKDIMFMIRKAMKFVYPYYWFKLDKKIKQKVVYKIEDKYISNAKYSFATAYTTSGPVNNLSSNKGEKIYFIQDYEKWGDTTDDMLIESYKYNMKKIVVSRWLKNIVDKYSSEESILISNGINIDNFKVLKKIEERNPYTLTMLYNNDKRKGCEYGLEVIRKLKKIYPDLTVTLFGYPKRPKDLEKWIKYEKNATEKRVAEILNNSYIYMCTSIQEGFGLPGIEAMACGCILVTTDCKGILEYANENNSKISEPKDVEKMYKNICEILENKNIAVELSKNGTNSVKGRNIEEKSREFYDFLTKIG